MCPSVGETRLGISGEPLARVSGATAAILVGVMESTGCGPNTTRLALAVACILRGPSPVHALSHPASNLPLVGKK